MIATFEETKRTKYLVDDKGNIYSCKKKGDEVGLMQKRKRCLNRARGYMYIRTTKKNLQVHRLVASAFIPNPDNKEYVNHKDGDKTNNAVENLEWVTPTENAQHAIENGLTKQFKKNQGANLKYTQEQVNTVYNLVMNGATYSKAGSVCGMPYSTVAHLMRGSRRKI